MIGCIPEVLTLLLTPISTYVCIKMPDGIDVRNFIYVINDIYDIYDIHDIWHLKCIYMSIWVSKEVLGPQECSQPSYISHKIVFNNGNILFPEFSFVFS